LILTDFVACQGAVDFSRAVTSLKSCRRTGNRNNQTNHGERRQAEHCSFHRIILLVDKPGWASTFTGGLKTHTQSNQSYSL